MESLRDKHGPGAQLSWSGFLLLPWVCLATPSHSEISIDSACKTRGQHPGSALPERRGWLPCALQLGVSSVTVGQPALSCSPTYLFISTDKRNGELKLSSAGRCF